MRRSIVTLVLGALAGCAAPDRPRPPDVLCAMDRAGEDDEPGAGTWLALLLSGWDPATRRATQPAVDCSGAQVRWEGPALRCADGSTALAALPDRPLGAGDVVVARVGEASRIVWIVTTRFASGDGLGPVAVVDVGPRGRLAVRALGHLRAPTVRTRLRLERLQGAEVLVAEGEVCGGADPASCARSARLLPLEGQRYVAAPVASAEGACLSPALFDLAREETAALPSGWRRRYRLDATLAFAPEGLRVQEAVVVSDHDPRSPGAPARPYRRAEADHEVRLEQGRFVSGAASLWSRMAEAR